MTKHKQFCFLANAVLSLVTAAEVPTYQLRIVRGCSVWTASDHHLRL